MQLSDAERLMLALLCEIHEASDAKGGVNSSLVKKALCSGNEWAITAEVQLPWKGDASNPPYVSHVLDVLDMWLFLEDTYASLTAEDAVRFRRETGHEYDPQFPGFDGHSETDECKAAQYVIEEMGRFGKFRGRSLTSQHPTIARSRRMLSVFVPIRATLGNRKPALMTADELISVVKA